jgi:hypothetical protein
VSLRPVKVTAVLSAPLGGDAPMLDALCESVMAGRMGAVAASSGGHRHGYTRHARGQDVHDDAPGKIPIPVAREWIDGLPVPRCSSPVLPVAACDRATHYASAFPIDKTGLLAPRELTKVTASGGRFKSFRLPLRTRLVDRVVWFAALRPKRKGQAASSPMAQLRKLLRQVHGIGKKDRHGYGTVAEWLVEPIDDDLSWFAPSEAGPVLMRPLPVTAELPDGLLGCRRDYGGVCGPYWQRSFWVERVTPC